MYIFKQNALREVVTKYFITLDSCNDHIHVEQPKIDEWSATVDTRLWIVMEWSVWVGDIQISLILYRYIVPLLTCRWCEMKCVQMCVYSCESSAVCWRTGNPNECTIAINSSHCILHWTIVGETYSSLCIQPFDRFLSIVWIYTSPTSFDFTIDVHTIRIAPFFSLSVQHSCISFSKLCFSVLQALASNTIDDVYYTNVPHQNTHMLWSDH